MSRIDILEASIGMALASDVNDAEDRVLTAVDYAKCYRRSRDAVIRVYNAAGNVD